jgi:NodT family efflux transporter outer membrane factor (OMF) lipoprotein
MKSFRLGLTAVVLLLSAGCMVGPDYSTPSVPMTAAYKEDQGWKLARPLDQIPRGKWWEIFGDPQLNVLEEQVSEANQNVKVAEARFRQARALIGFFRAGLFPTVTAGASALSVRRSTLSPFSSSGASTGTSSGGGSSGGSSSGASTGEFLLTGDVSYEIDLWGRIRRSVTSARDEAQATAADLETARLSLQAELAFDYFELRSADAQQRLLNDTVKAFDEALQLTIRRFEGGAAPKSDVAQAQTQLETTQVQATDIAVQRAAFEHAIATLLGKPPADFSLPPAPLDLQPPDIPAGLPSELLERRPDIAAAERRVAEANEQIGIAKAAYFPTVTLNALLGFESSSIRNFGDWQSFLWAVGSSVAQTIFDAGRRRATSEAALANYDATVATYRQATLDAFQQVEDNLAALRILELETQQQARAVISAQESLQLFTNRYKGGVDTYLQVITAQTAALSNERNQVDILRRRMDASVLLVKAVGGGWNVMDLPNL